MTVVWTTLATLFLLKPGFAFIAGLNITDKNVREIVFRGTPAELAYILAISLIVHTFFQTSQIRPCSLIDRYVAWSSAYAKNAPLNQNLSEIVVSALRYFIMAAVTGGLPGWALGTAVARNKWAIFIKHRWMIELLGADKGDVVFATVLTAPKNATGGNDGDFSVLIQRYIRDCFLPPTVSCTNWRSEVPRQPW